MLETIVAIATPHGSGGIAIVRLSGERAIEIAGSVFGTDIKDAKSHTIHYGKCIDEKGEQIDECLLSLFRAPRSYTKEDVVEISCHGGTVAVNRLLEALINSGARLATPGEFTMRAFLNGRIDLTQAEAVADIISSKTNLALTVAVNQLEGSLSKKINELRHALLALSASISVSTDFPEEDIEELTGVELKKELNFIKTIIEKIISTAQSGKLLRDGAVCAIVGKPNTGKSSLLNALVRDNRAIVTDVAGTTRDVVEEYISIDGIPLRLADTAGIRLTEDTIESMGVQKSKDYIKRADICIFVLDFSDEYTAIDEEIYNLVEDKKHVVAVNKIDLTKKLKHPDFNAPILEISTLTGEGLDNLEKAIKKLLVGNEIGNEVITNMRHKDACIRAYQAVIQALETVEAGMPPDMALVDIETAIEALGSIIGMSISDEIVHEIFGRFCLGK